MTSVTKTPCPFCSAAGGIYKESHQEAGIPYRLYECPLCKVQYWTPFKNPGASWYEHDERYASRNADPILEANKKHRMVMEYFKNAQGRVLDVGCGVGNFLAYARAKGWECYGIDFDYDAIEAGKEAFHLQNLEVASLPEFATRHTDTHFELITFFDVFEHLDNHNEFLAHIRGLLAPSGSIALSVPYRRGWRFLMQGDVPPRHLSRFDESSLTQALRRAGFVVTYLTRYPASLYFIALKLKGRYGKWTSFNLVGKAKKAERMRSQKTAAHVKRSMRIQILHALAVCKDVVLFGIPALVCWLLLLPTSMRYTDMVVIARKGG